MMKNRSKRLLSAALALGLFGAGTLVYVHADSPKAAEETPAKVDVRGDALPEGAVSRLGTLRWRHTSPVTFVAYSADAKEVITVCQDGAIRVWEASSGKELRKFGKITPGGAGGVMEMQLNRNAANIMLRAPFGVTAVALSPDSKTLVVSGRDNVITLWDVASGKELRTVALQPFGANLLFFAPDGKSFFARTFEGMLRRCDVAEGKEVRQYGEAPNGQRRVNPFGGAGGAAVSADGKTLLAVFAEFTGAQVKTTIKSWDVESGKELASVNGPEAQGGFQNITFSGDAKLVAFGHYTGSVHLWDVAAAGKEKAKITLPQNVWPSAMAFSRDNRNVVFHTTDQALRLFSVAEGKERLTIGEAAPVAGNAFALSGIGLANGQSNLAFSPDDKTLATATNANTIVQFDLATGKEVAAESNGHHGAVSQVALSPDGKSVVTRAADNVLRQWEAATGKLTKTTRLPALIAHVAFTADSKTAALGASDGTILLWDVAEGKELKNWKASAQPNVGFLALAISPDGKTIAIRGYDQAIRLFDAAGRELRQVAVVGGGEGAGNGIALADAKMAVPYRPVTQALAFSPDGTLLAGMAADMAPGGNPGAIRPFAMGNSLMRLWDVSTGKQVRKFEAPKNNALIGAFAFSPDGRTIATTTSDFNVTLWEAASGKERDSISFKNPAAAVPEKQPVPNNGFVAIYPGMATSSCITYSPDGKVLAVGGSDGVVRIADALTGKERPARKGHQAAVVSLAFAADGKFLASGSNDTTALVWELPAGEQPPAVQVEGKQAELLCDDLADANAAKAYQAVRILSQVPKQAVPLLKERVQAVAAPDAQKVAQLITDLDSNAFATRKKAEDELEKMGELAEDALRKALEAKPNLEMQKRLETLLSKLVSTGTPSATQLRAQRALEVLEAAGTPESVEVLQGIAKGAPGARLTRDAQAALDRLGKR